MLKHKGGRVSNLQPVAEAAGSSESYLVAALPIDERNCVALFNATDYNLLELQCGAQDSNIFKASFFFLFFKNFLRCWNILGFIIEVLIWKFKNR